MSSNKPEICRNFNRRLHSTCEKANNKCTHGRFHKCSTCNKWGCKAVRHESQQANAVTAINQPASPSNPPVSSEETLFGLPAFTDPTAVPANTQTQVGNRNILWTSVISAGKSLPLPLDSCCSVSLVSADHAQAVITERPLLQYRKLAEPIPVSVADAKANLTATAVMDIPIKWNNGKDCVFTMLVVPRLTWPILFGENHLHATKALVDHAQPSVTFRHPSMQFSVQCSLDNPLKGFANSTLPSSQVTSSSDPTGSATPHVGVTCLLTDAPLPGQPKGSTSLRRGLNLVTVCLTLSSVFVGFRGTNPSLWLEGQEVQPGVKVLSGPFDWQSAQSNVIPKEPPGAVCHASLCDIQEDQCQCPETEELPDFTSVYYTTVAIECKQKHSSLPQNVILGHIRPPTAQDQEIFQQAADATSEQLAEAWVTWVDTQTQPELSTCTSKANTTRPTLHELSGKHSTPQSEMQAAGLDSALLSPFREPVELAQDTAEFLPDTAHAPLDPYSEEYYNALLSALKLDTDMYSHVDPEILLEFKGLLRKYSTAFWLPGIPLTEVQGFEHHIHTDNSLPVYKHPYRKSPAELRAIKTEIQRMLKLKIIEPSNSEWGAPCILVRKPPENGVEQPPRFVVDYRGLNSVTRSDGYPIPSVANVLDSVSQGKVFGRCDLASGYWQIPLRKQDQPKSAFCTHVGLYHFLRLPFGMKTAPSTFQRILNTVFADYLHRWLIAYVDDLITWAQTQREALHQYSLLLERAVQVNIQFKPSKCVFFATEIELLGHYVNQAGRKPNSRGIEAITAMNSPANITQLKQFLGLCGYFRDYVPNMSNHTLALRQLLKKGVPFHWTSEHEKDFKALKHLVTGPTVMLYHPRWDDNFEVHVDASKHGCGAMLAQEINGELRPVRFASRAFSPTESRWTTMQQELFAVKWGLDQFRPYILGRRIKVVTDHANLKWLTTIAPQQAKVARWCMSMAEFDFYIQHRPGVQNVVPDVLSRYPVAASPDCHLITLPDSRIETFLLTALSADVPTHTSQLVCDTFSETVMYLSSACLLIHPGHGRHILNETVKPATNSVAENHDQSKEKEQTNEPQHSSMNVPEPVDLASLNPTRAQYAEAQRQDYWYGNLMNYLTSDHNKTTIAHLPEKHQQWIRQISKRTAIVDGLLMYRDEFMDNPSHYRIMVPNDIDLQRKLLKAYHDSPLGMHRGREATYESLSYDYYWRNIAKHVRNWIRRCPKCLKFKTADPKHGPMQVRIYNHPFHTLGIDYVGPLPVAPTGNKWILTAVCPYSNFLVAIPVTNKQATTAARALFDHVFLQYGFPSVLQSDQGGEWVNAVVHQLMKLLSIDHVFTTSYRPRLNGSTERVHRWLNSAIAIYCNKYQSNWQDFLQPAVYTHNVSPIPGTGKISPFFLVFGRHAPSPETLILHLPPHPLPKQTYAENLVSRIGEAQKHFNRIKADIKRCQREHYDQSSRDIKVDVGMRVYVRRPPPTSQPKGLTPRFTRRFDGPFLVTGHVHGRQDLLRLRHETTGQDMRTVNIEKIIVVPEGNPHDIRPENEQPVQASNEPQVTNTPPVSPDLAKVAFAFGQYLSSLPKPQAYVSEACKAVYETLPGARDILTRCGKLKGLVSKCPYLSMKGGAQGGTYLLVLDVKLFNDLNK